MQEQQSSRYAMVSQKYWCHNCCRQFSTMRSSADISSNEVLCNICNSVCEQVSESNNPRNFRVFDSHTTHANANSSQNSQNNNTQNHGAHIHFHVFYPMQEIIFLQRPAQQANPSQTNQTQSNNSNPDLLLHMLDFPFMDLQLLRRIQMMRLFEQFMAGNQQEGGAPPADKEVIKQIPEIVFEENNLEKYKNSPCPVCQEDFKLKETGKELKCHHMFHKDCIEPWLNMHRTCPCCRNEVA